MDDATPAQSRNPALRILKFVGKTLAWIIGIVLLLLVVIILAIQVPAVQNKLLGYAIPTIEDLLGGANVEIDRIDLDFFDAAQVEGVLVEDMRGDTFLYARQLGIDIGAFSLFSGELYIDEATLDGAVVNAYQLAGDTAFNYQFILDAFAPADTVVADTAAAAFTVGVDVVDITNTRIRLLDEIAGTDLNLTAQRLYTDVGLLNLDTLAVGLDEVRLAGVNLSFEIDAVDPVAEELAGTAIDTLASGATEVVFPTLGFPFAVDRFVLDDINVVYEDANTERVEEGLDAGNIDIQNLQALAEGFVWDSTALALNWRELSFRERSGLQVNELAFDLAMSDRGLDLDGLAFRTDASAVLAQAGLEYEEFAALVNLDPDLQLSLKLADSYLAMSDLALLAPTLDEAGINLDATANIFVDGAVSGSLRQLNFDALSLRVGQGTAVAVTGTLSNPLDPDALAYDLNVNRLTSSYNDLRRLTSGIPIPPELAEFGRFRFSGNVSGTTTTFNGRNLDLRTDGRTGFRGDLALRNLDNPDNLYIDADVQQLRTSSEEIAGFVPDSLGVDVMALGDIDFRGTFEGTVTDFDVDAQFDSDLGSVRADLVADFNADYTDGTYKGSIALDSFEVGQLLQDTTLGAITLEANVDGSGLTPEALVSSLDGTIKSVEYMGYTYKEITIDGDLDRNKFTGKLAIDDPNLKLDFEGLVNLRDSIPDLIFTAHLDTAVLHKLNLYPTPLGVSLGITANLRGNNADNLVGRLLVDSIYLQDSARTAYIDSLLLRAGDTTDGRFIAITSDILNAAIVGDYSVNDLPILLTNYINDFFPVDEFLSPMDVGGPEFALEPDSNTRRLIVDQSFAYRFELRDPTDVVAVFDPSLERLDTASFVGTFDSREKALTGRLFVPDLSYAGTTADTILLDIGGDVSRMLLDLRTAGLNVAGQDLDLLLAGVRLGDDSLSLSFDAFAEEDSLFLATGMAAGMNDAGRYVATFTEDLTVAGQLWAIDDANRIEYWDNYLDIDNLTFSKDDQRIGLRSEDESEDADIAPITVTIDNYNLAEIARIVNLEGFTLAGRINGKAGIRDPLGDLYYIADFTVDDIVLNEQPVGTFVVNATSEDLAGVVAIDVRLDGPVNDVSIVGEYGISSGALDIIARIRAFELRVIDPMAQGVLADSEGLLKADLTITGTATEPNVNGYMALDGAETTLELLGTRYHVADSRIELTEKRIDFGTFVIADSLDRTATISGVIDHDYFATFEFDLNLQTDGFRVLNLEPTLQELYYGQAIVRADIDIGGDLFLPVVSGTAGTLAGTDVYIVPLISANGVSKEDWVIYADPATIEQDTAQSLLDVYQANALGIDLSMVLDVDDDAVMHVIIDPLTGDALRAVGNADMNLQMTPDGEISVTGRYAITEGSYQFTFQQSGLKLVQRNFAMQPGSYMQFVGDPLDTRFDITAIYELQTTTAPLVANQPSSDAQQAIARQRQLVHVLLGVTGDLEEPIIEMEVDLPESGGNELNNEAKAILASLTEQQTYQQVFSLLVLGSFSAIGGASGDASGFDPGAAAGTAAINSVSGLVTGQLNKLASGLVGDAFDVNIGVESYNDSYDNNARATTANIDLSRSLFNDRLTITFGTDINVEQTANTANTGGLQTNFVLAYKLTESGRYRVKVFRRPDFDIISTGTNYENGAGVSYQRRFD